MSQCIVDERDDAEAARRALLAHPAVFGADLQTPAESCYDAWTVELSIVHTGNDTDGFEPEHQRTAAQHGLATRETQPRSPVETRVLLTL